ncbi:hypothetical protein [Parasutterella excrementihominis]|uniref:hypothetical protein n=1 Tax=Parasutterella excrementihominis TaxID=487175 RepID=UPI00242AF5BD|nr:hypothetical protein [Parasutterella excrementihominis]
MNELKQKIDEIVNKTVPIAYFNEAHEFLYLRPDTLANFAGLRFKEENGGFYYTPTDKEEWKSVPADLESLEDLIDVRTLEKGVYFKDKDEADFYFYWEKEYGRISEKKYTEIVEEIGLLLEKGREDRNS